MVRLGLIPVLLTLLLGVGCAASGGITDTADGLCVETVAFLEARSDFRELVASQGDTVAPVEAMADHAGMIADQVRAMSEAPFSANAITSALKLEESYDRKYRIDWALKMDRIAVQEGASAAFLSFAQSCPGADLNVPAVSAIAFVGLSGEEQALQSAFCSIFTELMQERAAFRVHVDRGVTAWSVEVARTYDRVLVASEALDAWYTEHGRALHPTTQGGAPADFSDIALREVHTRQAVFQPVALPTIENTWDEADEAVVLGAQTCPDLDSSLLEVSTHVPGRTYRPQFVISAGAASAFCSVQAGADIDSCVVRDPETGETLRVEETEAFLDCAVFERALDAQEGFRQRMIAAVEGDETAILDAKYYLHRAALLGGPAESLLFDASNATELVSLGVPEQTIFATIYGHTYRLRKQRNGESGHQAFLELIGQLCELDQPISVGADVVSAFTELLAPSG